MKIENTVAVVTGGASGLGEAVVRAVLQGGGKAAILDLNEDKGAALAAELGPAALFRKVDVTDEAALTSALEAASAALGAITLSVSCAGIAIAEKTLGRDGPHRLSSFSKVVDINLIGSFNLARLVAERMQHNAPNEDGERGLIVHTASIAAYEAQKGQPAYGASKGGVVGMVLPMARDLATLGIRVNALAPGLFLTPMLEGLPEEAQEALAKQPLFPKRLGRPSEIGQLVRFMVECPYLNGETIRLDGGIRLP